MGIGAPVWRASARPSVARGSAAVGSRQCEHVGRGGEKEGGHAREVIGAGVTGSVESVVRRFALGAGGQRHLAAKVGPEHGEV